MNYFPFLRGKLHELIAVRDLAEDIAHNGHVIPIIEPVNSNRPTLISLAHFIDQSMPFLFICNPKHGDFSSDTELLADEVINQGLSDYDNWIPALYVNDTTALREFEAFKQTFGERELALVYDGRPQRSTVRSRIESADIKHHVFINGRIENDYIQSIPNAQRVIVRDPFRRQPRNADYPRLEFFTDLNTVAGNPDNTNFGDFSIVGDYYMKTGGAAHAVALHHVHFTYNSCSLSISHFISDRTATALDTPGKTIEAVDHLVEALDSLQPNDLPTCDEYREMSNDRHSRGLGYMKRLAIKHHLEVMLHGGGLGS